MDIPRKGQKRKRTVSRIVTGSVIVVLLSVITVGLSRLEPACPSVEREALLFDKVEEGDMTLEVRGIGTLVSEDMMVVPALVSGRITKILVEPGTVVDPNTVILVMDNPELHLQLLDAESALNSAKSRLIAEKARLLDRLLDMQAGLAQSQASYERAKLSYEVEKQQFSDGLISELQFTVSQNAVENQGKLLDIQKQRFDVFQDKIQPSLLSELEASVKKAQSAYDLRKSQEDSLFVRAGVAGVLSPIQKRIELGQQIASGQILARITNPERLEARLQIPQGQARDIQIGLPVEIDTYNGIISGSVSRIEPTVVEGNVSVDIHLDGQLPKGARPDLSVVGTIQIDRLTDILYVGRPVMASADSQCELFKIIEDGKYAVRIVAKLGRTSVSTVEILDGLALGDEIILSDISQFEEVDKIRMK